MSDHAGSIALIEDEELDLDGFLRALDHFETKLQSGRSSLESFYLVDFGGMRVGRLCVRKGEDQIQTQDDEGFKHHHA